MDDHWVSRKMRIGMNTTSLNKKSPVSGKSKSKPGVKTTTKPKFQRAEQRATSIKTLKDSELRYRRLFEAAQDGILILDARTGAIDDVNPYLIDMLGYSREEFVKRKLWEVGAFKNVEASKIEFKVLQEKGFVRHENLPLRTKGGQLIQVEFVSNVYLAGGRKVIQCNIRNITDQFRAEEALRESDKRFRALIENSSDAITLLDAGGRVVFDSPAAAGMLGYAPEDWYGKEIFPLIHPEDLPEIQGLFQTLAGTPGARAASTFRVRHKSGAWLWIEATAANLLAEPAVKAMVINYRDITDRKQAEEALRDSEEVFRGFLEQSEDAIMLTDEKGVVTQWSKGAEKLTGYARDESVGKPLWDVQLRSAPEAFKSTELYEQIKASLQSALLTGQGIVLNHLMEIEIQRPDGTRLITQTLAFPIHTQKGLMLGSILRDISELKRAQETAQHSADLLSEALDIARLAHWEYDVEKDLFLFNDNFYSIFHTTAEREGGYRMSSAQYTQRFVHPDDAPVVGAAIEKALASTDRKYRTQLEHRILYSDGGIGTISVVIHIDRDEQGRILRYYGVNQDITQRKLAEEALAKSEREYRTLFENMPIGQYRTSADGRFLDANQAMVEMFGYKNREALLAENVVGFCVDPASDQKFKTEIEKAGVVAGFEAEFKRADGSTFWAEDHNHVIRDEKGKPLFYEGSLIDITERKQAEETRTRLASIVEDSDAAILGETLDGIIVSWNSGAERLYGYSPEEIIGQPISRLIPPDHPNELPANLLRIKRGDRVERYETIRMKKDGTRFDASLIVSPIKDAAGQVIAASAMAHDITGPKRANERIQRQVDQLAALHLIDQVITSSFDLRNNLTMILEQATRELRVDAADVLLLNNANLYLEYGAGAGFRTKAVEKASVRLGQDYAGRVALERQLLQIPNVKDQADDFLNTYLAGEHFMSYIGVPLVAKGSVKGVLEVCHRSPLQPDQEWLDFLNILAGQAAMAIDSAALFDNLQRSNMELSLAYDATIEGWSHAMDLRDKETEGHTLRVTEMTMELAGLFRIQDEDLVNIRRGALLHDIGKMGVPDAVLLKPAALTDEEWVLMRKHPIFAFEMLSSIRYLKSAVDIPYCHHEKWDGTGYPRGLKGEQIPLAARLFAIVDVWDAITSDRPYREAWSNEKAIEYLKSETGKQFDPQILKVCLDAGVFERKQ